MLQLARRALTNSQYQRVLSFQTRGGFFHQPPMLFYGSTITGYAAAFGLKRAVWMILEADREAGLPNKLNDPGQACHRHYRISSILPQTGCGQKIIN